MQSFPKFRRQPIHFCVRISRVVVVVLPLAAFAQELPSQPEPQTASLQQQCALLSPRSCIIGLARDEKGIVTSPLRLRKKDFVWLLPVAAATGTAIAFDREALRHVGTNPADLSAFRRASNLTGLYMPVAAAAGALLGGSIRHDEHLRETGSLAMTAMLDTQLLTTALKFGTSRARPSTNGLGPEAGTFWPDGRHSSSTDSFPSGHAANAFAVAHVIADEYPGWKVKLAVYGLAAATGFERVAGREHFPSDVLVGGAIGYFIGGYIFDHHSSRSKTHISFAPMIGHGGGGVSVQISRSAN